VFVYPRWPYILPPGTPKELVYATPWPNRSKIPASPRNSKSSRRRSLADNCGSHRSGAEGAAARSRNDRALQTPRRPSPHAAALNRYSCFVRRFSRELRKEDREGHAPWHRRQCRRGDRLRRVDSSTEEHPHAASQRADRTRHSQSLNLCSGETPRMQRSEQPDVNHVTFVLRDVIKQVGESQGSNAVRFAVCSSPRFDGYQAIDLLSDSQSPYFSR